MATKVRLASQYLGVAHNDCGSYHSADAILPLHRLGIPVVMVGHHLLYPSRTYTGNWVVVGGICRCRRQSCSRCGRQK